MEKKQLYLFVLVTIMGSLTLLGCSSSEVSDDREITADELPVVDAQTDALPDSIDGAVAENAPPPEATEPTESASADALPPEATVDMPAQPDVPSTVAEAPVSSDVPENSPSYDAPPSMNERAPVNTAAEHSGGGSELYAVQSGDTLMKIAFKVYGDVYQWRKIFDANNDRISDPARLVKGTQLRVDNTPSDAYYDGFERYLIKSGDTLGYIAGDVYGTKSKWKQLWKMNDGLVKDPNRIYAGFFLRYTMTEEERQRPSKPAPLAESGEGTVRNPSSFQEAKIPSTPTTATQ